MMLSRRRLEIALGALWLLDGALQFQPYMFTKSFFAGILGMANMGLPRPLSTADFRVASLLVAHPAVWNAVFASVQVALGAGFLWPRTATLARLVSIPWALGVWAIGEGFGGMFMGGASLIGGVPGAALLYAVAAVVLWPGGPAPRRTGGPDVTVVAAHGRFGEGFAVAAWTALWCGSALFELQRINQLPGVPGAQLRNAGYGQPGLLERLNVVAGGLVGHDGRTFAVVLGMTAFLVGIAAVHPSLRPAALTAGIVVAVFVGVIGQDVGSIFTGRGTDPGSGPLLVLLALTLWPVHVKLSSSPAHQTVSRPAARRVPVGAVGQVRP